VRPARIWKIAAVEMLALGAALTALPGCGVGERPTLAEATAVGGDTGTPTGNAAADAVLARLEGHQTGVSTADYTVATKFGGRITHATVARSGDRQSVTIGNIRFLSDGREQTCNVETGTCDSGIEDARVSDTAITSGFSAGSPARQLRVSLARRTGQPTGSTATVAGQRVTCVAIPVGAGRELTCATSEGLLATWDTASVKVDLTSLTHVADSAAFGPGG
jgi:hypothetical protein